MTRKELDKIYETEFQQAGDTEYDFYEWAVAYLLDELRLRA